MIEVQNGVPNPRVSEAVLFPFDNVSIPFSTGLQLHLAAGKTPGKANPIVLERGKKGEPDDEIVRFYGTVIPFGDELRMWYLTRGSLDKPSGLRVCYAVSRDGVNWEKPKLGLVEYNGSKENNIVDLRGGRCDFAALPVLYDPDDPNPDRRFKLAFESGVYGNGVAVAFSPDGFRWTESPNNPVAPPMEHTGLIKFNGCYYINGQDEFGSHGSQFGRTRKLVTFASYDFEHWTQASCLGLRRDNVPPRPMMTEWNASEEVHLGAGLWDRGNMIIGVYDMWHGYPTSDRKDVTMDLGLVVSNDALHYREPIPDFKFVAAFEELNAATGRGPTLSHGQGMCNVGEQTMLWYETWGGPGDVRLATWPRDRLGYFQIFRPEWTLLKLPDPHCITCPVRGEGSEARVYANVDGVSEHCSLTVELLDEQFRPLPGYSGDDCVPLREPGLRQPLVWRDRDTVGGIDGPFRLRVNFAGIRPEDAKLYALYVT